VRERIGIITTGQGPREEYDAFHSAAFAAMGAKVEVVSRHVLDDVDPRELHDLEPIDGAPAIHANVRGAESDVSTLGPGWRNVWLDRGKYVERVQLALDSLESESLSIAIVCVAEELPPDDLHFSGTLVLPFGHLRAAVESAARSREAATIAVFSYGVRQRQQQEAAWSREPWMRRSTFHYFELNEGWASAGEKAARLDADFGLIMGYGAGLLGADDGLAEMREQFHAPVLVPHMIACAAARQYVRPQQNPRDFLNLS
jgi:protein AroM